jgi:hypothetical protein
MVAGRDDAAASTSMKTTMRKLLRRAALTVLAIVLAIQFVRPDRTNSPIRPEMTLDGMLRPPESIARLLSVACYDCHSDATRWPWYSHVAPVSWLVARDVNEAREFVNFSRFGEDDADTRSGLLEEAAEEVSRGSMPLPIYGVMHAEARLTDEQRRELAAWFNAVASSQRGRDGERNGERR